MTHTTADTPWTTELSARFAEETVQFMENMLSLTRDMIASQMELVEIVDAIQHELAAPPKRPASSGFSSSDGLRALRAEAEQARLHADQLKRRARSIGMDAERLRDETHALRRLLHETVAARAH